MISWHRLLAPVLLAAGMVGFAQQAPPPQQPAVNPPVSIRPDYVLGSNDQILIRVPQSDEINERPFRVDNDGFITLPIVGRVQAAGITVQALEGDLTRRLREFIREPQVSISVTQFRNEPVFIVGAFRNPGVYVLQGRRTLVEMLSTVGGLQTNASRRIKVTRRAEYGAIPLPTAVQSADRKVSSVEISLDALTQNINPDEDLTLQAYDVISADRAERIYVTGEVAKVSAIELGERDSISVLQALTEAGGFTQFAVRDKVRLLRPIMGTTRRAEIDIDLTRIYEGKDIDFPLLPNDVIFVPRAAKRAALAPVGTAFLGSIPVLIITALLR